jgi:hypothetical protein
MTPTAATVELPESGSRTQEGCTTQVERTTFGCDHPVPPPLVVTAMPVTAACSTMPPSEPWKIASKEKTPCHSRRASSRLR